MLNIQKFKIPNNNIILGVDEVGRGSLIGPVITCCLSINTTNLFNHKLNIPYKIDDSKKLNKKNRKLIVDWVNNQNFIKYTIADANIYEIDELNILQANNKAMNKAIYNHINNNKEIINFAEVNNIKNEKINCYIDGNYFNPIMDYPSYINFKTIIKGDANNLAIALASIIAKEYRDDLILKLVNNNREYINYGWNTNMGYGTKQHFNAILKHGITIHHRLSFLKKIINY